ncbi:MAG: LamG-like jellyroll fold domain-containing protein [Patescibacteria group bacterium]
MVWNLLSTPSFADCPEIYFDEDCGQEGQWASGNYGCPLAEFRGITAHSNGDWTGGGCGFYQCVEYVKRFYEFEVLNPLNPISGGVAKNAFDSWASTDTLDQYVNGESIIPPESGDIICFGPAPEHDNAGHVGIIMEVGPDYVLMIDQNRTDGQIEPDPKQLSLSSNPPYSVGSFSSSGAYVTQGWLRDPDYGGTYDACWSSQTPIYPPGLDYYPVAPGQVLNVSFTFNNLGTAYWTNDENSPHYVELQSVTGPGSAEPWSDGLPSELAYDWIDPNCVAIVSTEGDPEGLVNPGGQGLYSFQIQAPFTPGDYYLYVALYRPHSGEHFSGEGLTLKIRVDPLSAGLVAYWSFDAGDAGDNSGNGNDGTVYGATPVDGISGLALDFDGIDDHIDLGNAASLNPPNALTLAAWYRPVSFQGTGNDPLFDKGYLRHAFPYYQYHLGACGDQYDGEYYAKFLFSVTAGSHASVGTDNGFWTPGNWYFVVGTYDGSAIELFVNAEFIGSCPLSGTIQNYGKNLRIGRYSNFDGFLPGTVDEVRLYDRALTDEDIAALYHAAMLLEETGDQLPDAYTQEGGVEGYIDEGDTSLWDFVIDSFHETWRLLLNWLGSELKLTAYRPDGTVFGEWQSSQPPITAEFVPDAAGEWTFGVEAIDIPHDAYPYALVAGSAPIGSISGTVVDDAMAGVRGVAVDVCDTFGVCQYTAHTDASGSFELPHVLTGEYSVGILPPLGYAADSDLAAVSVLQGADASVAFSLTQLDIVPNQQRSSYWRHELNEIVYGDSSGVEPVDSLCAFADRIKRHFNGNRAHPIRSVVISDEPECSARLGQLAGLFNRRVCHREFEVKNAERYAVMAKRTGPYCYVTIQSQAQQQLAALMLNAAAYRLSLSDSVSADGASVSQAITYCDSLIRASPIDCWISGNASPCDLLARDIAAAINAGDTVEAGIIPLDIPHYAYKLGDDVLPEELVIRQNYPNPFNPVTTVVYELPTACMVELSVYNILGQKVATLVDEYQTAGQHEISWAAGRYASGIYFYRIRAGDAVQTKKMVLLK